MKQTTASTIDKVEQPIWLEGFVSVQAALQAKRRPVHRICLIEPRKRKQVGQWSLLRRLAQAEAVPVEVASPDFIAAQVSGKSHGGVIAEVGPRRMLPLSSLLGGRHSFIVMLDGIEDPFNFGQAVRALYAAGLDGLVLRPRNWLTAAAVVTRASAGATEHMPTAVAETATEAAAFFRDAGLTIACTGQESAIPLHEVDLTGPTFLLLGGEKRGITRSFLRAADQVIEIPYGQADFKQSLGTVAATAVIAFEMLRQRSQAG